jgi:hypothetical protein
VQPEQQNAAAAVEHKAQQAAAAPATASGVQQDMTIAISPAAEQEIQRALLADNGEQLFTRILSENYESNAVDLHQCMCRQ